MIIIKLRREDGEIYSANSTQKVTYSDIAKATGLSDPLLKQWVLEPIIIRRYLQLTCYVRFLTVEVENLLEYKP